MSIETEFFATQRVNAASKTKQSPFAYGELSVYDPVTNSAKFLLPEHPETDGPNAGNPMETPFVYIGSPLTGPGYGAQFPPPVDAQALLVFVTPNVPVCVCFLYNDIEEPPFPDGKTFGWKDAFGNIVSSNSEGLVLKDLSNNEIQTTSSGITITSVQGYTVTMNASGITLTAPQVGIGNTFGSLGAGDALARGSDLASTASSARAADQANINAIIAAIQAADVPNSGSIIPPTAAGITAAPGSSSVRSN